MGIEVARPDPRRHPIAMHTHGPPSRRAPLEGDWTKWRAHDHGQCQWEHATYREREREERLGHSINNVVWDLVAFVHKRGSMPWDRVSDHGRQ
jgi:hypothetical protein